MRGLLAATLKVWVEQGELLGIKRAAVALKALVQALAYLISLKQARIALGPSGNRAVGALEEPLASREKAKHPRENQRPGDLVLHLFQKSNDNLAFKRLLESLHLLLAQELYFLELLQILVDHHHDFLEAAVLFEQGLGVVL